MAVAQTHNVTFTVDMSNYASSFTTVYVSGTLNGWSGNANALTDMGSGIWSATIPVTEGRHEFKFTIDDWTDQENFASGTWCTITNGGGFVNRVLHLDADMTYSVCWDACVACGQSEPSGTRDVTFSVDMTDYVGAFSTCLLYTSDAADD